MTSTHDKAGLRPQGLPFSTSPSSPTRSGHWPCTPRSVHPEDTCANATRLLETPVADWLWCFAALQVQTPAPPAQADRSHYDGGASCGLHLCLTYSGRRGVLLRWDSGEVEYQQRAGSLYVPLLVIGKHFFVLVGLRLPTCLPADSSLHM